MFQFALKRILYSILIMIGVLLVTFLLFRMAAGDPTETLLGKNPTPEEMERVRSALGTDKPLFWGKWRKTELYSSANFQKERIKFPGISYNGKYRGEKDGLALEPGAAVIFRRNFDYDESHLRIVIQVSGPVVMDRTPVTPNARGIIELALTQTPKEMVLQAADREVTLAQIEFFRPVKSPFDSQAMAAIGEIVSFHSQFPYVSFLNFGSTLQTREPIRTKLWHGMWASVSLMFPIFLGELVFGIALAMFSCIHRGKLTDHLIMVLSVTGMSISYLALIIFGQWFLAYYLNLFPVWGWGDPRHILLPVLIGIISGTGSGVRFYRTVFLNEINKEYLRTAVAKGCSPLIVYGKHLLKNAMIPIVTRASSVLPFLFTGSMLLESFFGIPGLGYEGINALNDADLQMLKALVILGAFLFIVINLVTDLAYAWLDPRVRINR